MPTPRCCGGASVTSSPSSATSPESGCSRPAMTRRSVDFPDPDGPRSAVSEPPAIAIETSSSATYSPNRLVTRRTAIATVVLLPEERHRQQGKERQHGQEHGGSVRAREVEGMEAILHVQRERLGAAREMAGDDRHRAVLAQAAGRREHDAVDDAPADRRERDAPERRPGAGAERGGGLLLLRPDLAQHGHDLADDERE